MTEPESKDDRAPTPPIRLVALTGFMGSGKSTVGRELAGLLGWDFLDLDERIEALECATIAELFRQRGEEEFRRIEHETLASIAAECSQPLVLALGGGAFVQAKNAEILQKSWIRTVFLEASVDVLFQRCSAEIINGRPLAAKREHFEKLLEQRLPRYREANVIVSVEAATAEGVARRIASMLTLPSGT